MEPRRAFTAGYAGRRPEALARLAERLDLTVFDVRFSPTSRDPRWRRPHLEKLLGDRYRHVGALGNVNYKGGPILLADP